MELRESTNRAALRSPRKHYEGLVKNFETIFRKTQNAFWGSGGINGTSIGSRGPCILIAESGIREIENKQHLGIKKKLRSSYRKGSRGSRKRGKNYLITRNAFWSFSEHDFDETWL